MASRLDVLGRVVEVVRAREPDFELHIEIEPPELPLDAIISPAGDDDATLHDATLHDATHDDAETIAPPLEATMAPEAVDPAATPFALTLVADLIDDLEASTIEIGVIHEIEILGDYVLIRHLARGAMCDVWLGLQMFLGELIRPVIVKRVDPELASDPELRRRFLRQAAIFDRVRSPNIAPVFELGMDASSFFVVTSFVQGASLAELLDASIKHKTPLPEAVAARIAADVLGGLHALHTITNNQGRVVGAAHLDLSANNVLIDFEGRVQLSDSGLGKAAAGFLRDQRGCGPYKARYRSPEEASGQRGTARSDQYSVGALLFEMVTGSVSPVAASEEERREILDALNPTLDPGLRAIILAAMAIDPAHRFRSAAHMKNILEGAIRQLTKNAPGSERLDTFMQQRFKTRMTELRILLSQATDNAAAALVLSQRRADKRALDQRELGRALENSAPDWSQLL